MESASEEWVYGYGLLVAVDCASDLPAGAVVVQRKQHPETATLECFEHLVENTDVTMVLGDSAFDTLELHDRCVDRQILLVCTYNPRNTADPLDIVFRIEAITEKSGVQFDRDALQDAFDGRIAVERFFSTTNEDDRRLDFHIQGRQRVETHVGLVLIDRLLNRNSEPPRRPNRQSLENEAVVITEQGHGVLNKAEYEYLIDNDPTTCES